MHIILMCGNNQRILISFQTLLLFPQQQSAFLSSHLNGSPFFLPEMHSVHNCTQSRLLDHFYKLHTSERGYIYIP